MNLAVWLTEDKVALGHQGMDNLMLRNIWKEGYMRSSLSVSFS